MELETELAVLCHDYFDIPDKGREPEEISQFFARLIQRHQKVQLTEEIRYFIPLLASYKNGILCPIIESAVDGISPLHFVPDLSLKVLNNNSLKDPKIKRPTGNRTQRAPRNGAKKPPQTARPNFYNNTNNKYINNLVHNNLENNEMDTTFENLPKMTLPPHQYQYQNLPHTARPYDPFDPTATRSLSFRKPLPPLKETQDNVLPTLYISDKQNFFVAKKTNNDELDFNILPPTYPDHMIGDSFAVLSASGVIMTHGEHSSVVDLGRFVEDLSNEYIVERQMFRLRYSYRFYYTWRVRYRDRLFRKIIHVFDSSGAIGRPGFSQFLEKIRNDLLSSTDELISIYPPDFDIKNDEIEFSDLTDAASFSTAAINERTRLMAEDTCRQIAELFKQIRAANLLIQLDFEELHHLNSLPPSLQTFASDLKWRVPSIFRQRMRENILRRERKLAGKRQNYLTCFFTRIRTIYTGLLINQCRKCLMIFFDRFSTRCSSKRKSNRLVANFDPEDGIKIYPSRTLFLKWAERTVDDIINAFISENKHISTEVIADIDPEYEFETEDPKIILSRYPDLKSLKNDAFGELNAAFNYVDQEVSPHSNFMKHVKVLSDEASSFANFRQCNSVETMINNLLRELQNLRKRPRSIYHTLPNNIESTDFVVDMKPSIESAGKVLEQGTKTFISNLNSDLNALFSEIQEKWATVKDMPIISREDCKELESQMVLFSTLCDMLCTAWQECITDIKASFDTIMGFYRGLNERCKFASAESITFFNKACQKIGIAIVQIKNNEESSDSGGGYEYEEEEEEDAN